MGATSGSRSGDRAAVIKAAQRLGYSLEEVAELLAAGRHHPVAGLQERAAKPAEADAKSAGRRVAERDTLRSTARLPSSVTRGKSSSRRCRSTRC
ncbi:MerR family DNA-binding protein [Streptomyces sp. NBC_00691]|uniref:MerR family DNA-binding protein n=1 Tax=Streptomyces sp. NBC_00691 TaxID=2903671 RepID=UPI002E31CF52|nr:MerR family DNA-binding protein [Streptomyces sp. NBC_00691]